MLRIILDNAYKSHYFGAKYHLKDSLGPIIFIHLRNIGGGGNKRALSSVIWLKEFSIFETLNDEDIYCMY